jgi:Rrf2 family protein
MMKFSISSEYALLSLIHLARDAGEGSASLEGIALAQHLPVEPLAETLPALVRGKYLRESRGEYRLAKPAEKISVLEIIRLFDGALAPLEPAGRTAFQPTLMEREGKLVELVDQVHDLVIERLEQTTLADLR